MQQVVLRTVVILSQCKTYTLTLHFHMKVERQRIRFTLRQDGLLYGLKLLADAHFQTSSICRSGPREVRADGLKIPELLEGVLHLFTLDQYVDKPVGRMDLVPSDKLKKLPTPVWDKYIAVINKAEGKEVGIELIERFAFYERAKKAFAIVHTGETAQYGNIILKKGVALK